MSPTPLAKLLSKTWKNTPTTATGIPAGAAVDGTEEPVGVATGGTVTVGVLIAVEELS